MITLNQIPIFNMKRVLDKKYLSFDLNKYLYIQHIYSLFFSLFIFYKNYLKKLNKKAKQTKIK